MSWWHKGSAVRRRIGAAGAVSGMVALAAACIPIRDDTFGIKGLVRLPETVGQVADMEVQPDGKVVVLASGLTSDLVRLNRDGTLDRTFGGDGIVTLEIGAGRSCAALELLPDGKMVVAGRLWVQDPTERYDGARLLRLNPDGTADTSFGEGGLAVPAQRAELCAIDVLPDGATVGTTTTWLGPAAVRWLPDGRPDAAFGEAGVAEQWSGLSRQLTITTTIRAQPDGRIVVAGMGRGLVDGIPGEYSVMSRFEPDGSVDATFGGGAAVADPVGGYPVDIAVRPDGRIVLAGAQDPRYSPNAESHLFALQYDSAGSRDPSFGAGGLVLAVDDGTCKGMTLLPDGKLVLVGGEYPDVWEQDAMDGFIAVRVNPDGSLDERFGEHGISITDRFPEEEAAYDVVVQPDGKLVVAGIIERPDDPYGQVGLAIYRYLAG
jgi:uncharacterized delta-60 repeat protein